jgi:hypothetical protein
MLIYRVNDRPWLNGHDIAIALGVVGHTTVNLCGAIYVDSRGFTYDTTLPVGEYEIRDIEEILPAEQQ